MNIGHQCNECPLIESNCAVLSFLKECELLDDPWEQNRGIEAFIDPFGQCRVRLSIVESNKPDRSPAGACMSYGSGRLFPYRVMPSMRPWAKAKGII